MKTRILLIASLLAVLPARAGAEEPERVILKLDDFLKLYEQTRKKDETPPRDHAIASARYRGEVVFEDGKPHAATFRTKMAIRTLQTRGWARVPVLPATVALQSATIGGKEAPVVIENGFYTLVTDRQGAFDLNLEFAAAVSTAEGRSAVAFQLTPSGATELELAVPVKEDLDFTVANAKLQSDEVVGANRVVKAALPATGSLSVSWQREIPEVEKKEARVYSEVYTLASIGDGVLRATTTVQNTILFAGVEQLKLQLPGDMTVLDVNGAGIRDWKAGKDGKLDVVLNYSAEGAYALTVEMERPLKAGEHDLPAPVVAPLGVERAKGWIGVESRGNMELEAGEVKDATPVDVRSLPASILGITDQPVLLGFKYLGTTPSIGLTAAQHDEVDVLVTLLDQINARTMWTREGRRLTSVTYQVRNNRRQFLRLTMPDGAELWSASVEGKAVQPARASDGRVMVPLVRSQSAGGSLSAFNVEVVYVESGKEVARNGKGTFQAMLPVADVPSTYVAWTVYSPEKTRVKRRSHDGNLEHVKYLSHPIPGVTDTGGDTVELEMAEDEDMARRAMPNAPMGGEMGGAAMGQGAAPVLVSLPLQGETTHFEKLLALDEQLSVSFAFRGLRK